ncbi:MAG: UDP-N-acetylglucosamine--N-acetylmuramyl-(pentapeptide) pyrophosphoryl-UDP N-acetylglucosamine [Candidatus Taylorbacteria bacterium]|nr:UDP-N-acetylglucosamine--N-acetylmuramyl-(pentapeptide) pyrophosphoryl-UDP N-acetylglucosamine [Candidatus Taylorbacteria bacterium]
MKIVFTGGGSGGHFYPIIAVVEAIRELSKERKILPPKLYYFAPTKYNPRALYDNEIEFVAIPAGKIRRYFSLLNITDAFVTGLGILKAIFSLYSVYPDVVFGKGGYASFPTLVAARLLRIPVVIHESDSHPGRVNAWASKFARYIAVAYPDAVEYFKKAHGQKTEEKIALIGSPVREGIRIPLSNGAAEFLHLEEGLPCVLVLGGSQGSVTINDALIESLPDLVKDMQIIHQTGRNNFKEVSGTAGIVLKDNPNASRYHPFEYLNDLAIRMSAGVSSVVISRAGSTIFEIAVWGLPSIIIPISEEVSHDQTKNAFAYARSGACSVIEEHNLSSHILTAEIQKIVNDKTIQDRMKSNTKDFGHSDSAAKLAAALLAIGLEHEK